VDTQHKKRYESQEIRMKMRWAFGLSYQKTQKKDAEAQTPKTSCAHTPPEKKGQIAFLRLIR